MARTGGVYVYGVVRSGVDLRLPADGVADAPVETIDDDGLAAVVSRLGERTLRTRRRDLLRHLRVIEAAFEATTVVPCAFGTVLEGDSALRHVLLHDRRDELVELLDYLDGRAQLNVKAHYDEDVVLREVVAEEAEIARLRERTRGLGDAGHFERIRLGELVAAAVAARRERDAERLLRRLAREAEDVVVEPPRDELVLNAAFLLSRERLPRFDAALESLARDEAPRLLFDAVGPLPPTGFAALDDRGRGT